MNAAWKKLVASAILGAAMLALAGPGQAEEKSAAGFVSLFNGKDLTGWKIGKAGKTPLDGKTEGGNGRFTVQDGLIIANEKDQSGKGGILDLYTVKSFDKDFTLKLEFRAALKADSGVYIRGPQLQVRDFIRRNEQRQLKKFKNDDWNELEIRVRKNVADCSINGEPLQVMRNLPAKGGIGLQAETGKFEFRNIRIREE